MRILIIYLFLFIITSCAKHHDEEKSMINDENPVELNEELEFNKENLIVNANNKYHPLVSQKLKELIEIQQFKKEHPEFEHELEEQFLTLSADSILLKNTPNTTIEHFEYLTELLKTSDSTEQINLKIKRGTITDSLTAIITSSKTYIDGKLFENKSIQFTTIKE